MPTPRQHALLSASSANRWLACTAAPHFEENFPDGTSPYAEEGTLAHAICELYARKKFSALTSRKFIAELKKLQARTLYSDETQKSAICGTASTTRQFASSRTAVLSVFAAVPSHGSAIASEVQPA